MTRLVKWSMLAFGVVSALVLGAAITVAFTFDINDYTVRIREAVHSATGRTLTVKGDVHLSYFPSLSVRIEGMTLSGGERFPDSPLVKTGDTRISIRILPLLFGKIRFHDLDASDVVVRLVKKADGTANWEGLDSSGVNDEAATQSDAFLPDIDGVAVKNGHVIWQDQQLKRALEFTDMTLTTGHIGHDVSTPVSAKLHFTSDQPGASGLVSLTGSVSLGESLQTVSVKDVDATCEVEGEKIRGGRQSGQLSVASATYGVRDEVIDVTDLTATVLGATVHLSGTLNGIKEGVETVEANVSVDPFNARKSLAMLGLAPYQMADGSALTSVGGQGKLSYTPDRIRVSECTVDVDGARLTGQAELRTGERVRLSARVEADRIDVDPYLPAGEASTGSPQSSPQWPTYRILHKDLLRLADLDVQAAVGEVIIRRVRAQSLQFEIKGEKGRVRVAPFKAALYSGTLSGETVVNARPEDVQTDLSVSLDDVDVGRLIADATGVDDYKGQLTFDGTASCQGERLSDLLASMNGKVNFSFRDGVFPGVNLIGMAKRTHDKQGKDKGRVTAREGTSTRYGTISGTGRIVDGVVHTKDLEIKAPGLWANGEGSTQLVSGKLNYLLKVKLVPLKHEKVETSDDLFGVTVPIRVAGSIQDPHYWVSISEYAKSLGGAVIDVGSSIIGGVFNAIKGVGEAFTPSDESP